MIQFSCDNCGMKFRVKEEFAGRRARCPTCKGPPQPVSLHCNNTQVSDLSPLKGMKLTVLYSTPARITRGLDSSATCRR